MITNLYQLTVRQVEELFTEATCTNYYNHDFKVHRKVINQVLKYAKADKKGRVYRYPSCTHIDKVFFKEL